MVLTPFPELDAVLAELVSEMKEVLGDELVGVYVQGSLALGDFDEHSDVDFVAVVEDEVPKACVDFLQEMHDRVFRHECPWARHLEGSYFPRDVLRDPDKTGLDLLYLDHGAHVLVRAPHCNTLIVRWTVRERGVALTGPAPDTLLDPIPAAMLRVEIRDKLLRWGREILNDPRPYENRFYQSFIVLSFCRMAHDLRRSRPGTKREGAEWAKEKLDPHWTDLIDGAWNGRPDPARKVRESPNPVDFDRTLEFVRHVMEVTRKPS